MVKKKKLLKGDFPNIRRPHWEFLSPGNFNYFNIVSNSSYSLSVAVLLSRTNIVTCAQCNQESLSGVLGKRRH